MDKDLVVRLREAHELSAQRMLGSTILKDAADEIERLRLLQYDIKMLYRDFIETMAWIGVFKNAEELIKDIESGKAKECIESQIREQANN